MGFDDQLASDAWDSGNPYAMAAGGAYEGFKSLEKLISEFGRGRREANVITPVQNQMWAVVKACEEEMPMASPERLVQLRDLVDQTWNQFETWIRSQTWADGRAAQQALDRSKDPYQSVQRVRGWIQGRLDALMSGSSADGAGAANSNAMAWIGGGLLAAKLLGVL